MVFDHLESPVSIRISQKPATRISLDLPLLVSITSVNNLGCVWFKDQVGWDMMIHRYWDKDIHVVCLARWMGRVIFLFGWMDESGWGKNSLLTISII